MRKVLLLDVSETEPGPSAGVQDSDGSPATEFLNAGRKKLRAFPTVTHLHASVDDVARCSVGFAIQCSDGNRHTSRALLLASDFIAQLPPVAGAAQFYGRSLHQCPYCDGWEHREQEIGVLGSDPATVDLALKLLQWSRRVTLFTNGGTLDPACEKRLAKRKIAVIAEKVQALEGQERKLDGLRLGDGLFHPCEALFYSAPRKYHSSLAARLGCDLERISDAVLWRPDGDTGIEGLFSAEGTEKAGDITVIAASEGIKAAEAANNWLLEADQSYLAVKPVPIPRANRPIVFSRR
jgi:thioredoxin reductase